MDFLEYGLWLVFEKKSGELIGRAGIENREIDGVTCCEIGYLIRRDMQHKGYAYEACQAILEYASDELGIQEMFAVIDKTNEPCHESWHKNLALNFMHRQTAARIYINLYLNKLHLQKITNQKHNG